MDTSEVVSTYIEFHEVEVPIEDLLGQKSYGFEIIMSSQSLEAGGQKGPCVETDGSLVRTSRLQPRATLADRDELPTCTCLHRGRVMLGPAKRHSAGRCLQLRRCKASSVPTEAALR